MKKNASILALCFIFFSSCLGNFLYPNLDQFLEEFITAIKSENPEDLRQFSELLIIDLPTAKYMDRNDLCIQGIPCRLQGNYELIKLANDSYYKKLKHLQMKLSEEGVIDSLELIDSVNYLPNSYELNDLEIKSIQLEIKMKSGPVYVTYPIGEIFYINNKWSLFGEPSTKLFITDSPMEDSFEDEYMLKEFSKQSSD